MPAPCRPSVWRNAVRQAGGSTGWTSPAHTRFDPRRDRPPLYGTCVRLGRAAFRWPGQCRPQGAAHRPLPETHRLTETGFAFDSAESRRRCFLIGCRPATDQPHNARLFVTCIPAAKSFQACCYGIALHRRLIACADETRSGSCRPISGRGGLRPPGSDRSAPPAPAPVGRRTNRLAEGRDRQLLRR